MFILQNPFSPQCITFKVQTGKFKSEGIPKTLKSKEYPYENNKKVANQDENEAGG